MGLEQEARGIVNTIRTRASHSTLPKGSVESNPTAYAPYPGSEAGALSPLTNTVTGADLLTAIYHERRVELGMEAIRFWDMVHTGTYLPSLPADVRARAMSHSITTGVVNPIPVLPLPLTEVQSWNLPQDPGY